MRDNCNPKNSFDSFKFISTNVSLRLLNLAHVGVSLHLTSSPNEFSWGCKLVDGVRSAE